MSASRRSDVLAPLSSGSERASFTTFLVLVSIDLGLFITKAALISTDPGSFITETFFVSTKRGLITTESTLIRSNPGLSITQAVLVCIAHELFNIEATSVSTEPGFDQHEARLRLDPTESVHLRTGVGLHVGRIEHHLRAKDRTNVGVVHAVSRFVFV